MSMDAIAWVRRAVRGLTGTERLVLLYLADHAAPHEGEPRQVCWPAIDLLAEETELSVRTVQRAIQALVDKGVIGLLPAYDTSTGRQLANRYTMLMDRPPPARGEGDRLTPSPGRAAEGGEGDRLTPRGCQPDGGEGDTHVTPGVTPVSPLNPKVNPKKTNQTRAREGEPGDGGEDPSRLPLPAPDEGPGDGRSSTSGTAAASPAAEEAPWRRRLRRRLGEDVWRSWIEPLAEPVPGTLVAPSRFHRDHVASRFEADIVAAMDLPDRGGLRLIDAPAWAAILARDAAVIGEAAGLPAGEAA